MGRLITGLFNDSDHAGEAIAELKEMDFTDDLSVVAKDEGSEEITSNHIDGDPMHGVKGGAISGAAVGGLGALALGATALTIPGLGLVVAGPLAVTLAGIAGGALTGGVVGAFVDQGISKDAAEEYESGIKNGQVLVSLEVDEDEVEDAKAILRSHGAKRVEAFES